MNFIRDKKELIVFDRNHCKTLLNSNKVEEAKTYLKYFFFSYENKIFFFNGYEFLLYTKEEALKLIPDDFKLSVMVPNEHTKKFEKEEISLKTYLKSTDFMNLDYKPTIDFSTNDLVIVKNKRIRGFDFKENYLNMAKPYNYDVLLGKPIIQTKELKESINTIYDHIKTVLCNGEVDSYEWFMNFIACSFYGRKVRKAVVLQSKERTGKGIIINDFLKEVLGDRMFKTNSVESIMRYTKSFEGCCLINFDELPHCDNYKGLQDNLKGLITEPEFTCRDMYSSGYQQKNTFNILITTNNDAISLTQNNNSRYVCLDINESKIGDTEYFKKLSKAMKYPNVLEQMYNDMKERFKTLDTWNEDVMPFTETRKIKIIEALPQFYKYIKEQFILTNTDINCRTNDFLDEYRLITKDKTSNQKIGRMLSELGIKPIKNSNNNGYNYRITCKDLYKIFKDKNWIDETIDLVNDDVMINSHPEFDIDEIPKMIIAPIVDSDSSCSEDELEIINSNPTVDDIEKEFEKAMKNKEILKKKSVKKSVNKSTKYELNPDKLEDIQKLSDELDKFI